MVPIEERNMIADFGIGFLIGGGAAVALAIGLVLLALTGWINSGSH